VCFHVELFCVHEIGWQLLRQRQQKVVLRASLVDLGAAVIGTVSGHLDFFTSWAHLRKEGVAMEADLEDPGLPWVLPRFSSSPTIRKFVGALDS